MKDRKLLSTFKGNNNYAVYNWFHFTEAYSRELVREIILKNPVKTKSPILYDPFCGTGTSLLVGKEFNYECYGTDISYLMYLVSKGKCLGFNEKKLAELLPQVLKIKKESITLNKEYEWIKQYFYGLNLQELLKIKEKIDNIKEDEKFFFYIVLLHTIEIVTRAKKQGADLKMRKLPLLDVLQKYQRTFDLFLKEYIKFNAKNKSEKEIEILNESCLTFYKTHDKLFDYIICSPPYLNKTEYTKRFGTELAILGKETILQNHLGHIKASQKQETKTKEWIYLKYFKKQLAQIKTEEYKHEEYDAHEYFKQLEIFIEESAKHLKKQGIFAVVIAGGVIGNSMFEIYDYVQDLYLLNKLEIVDIKTNREITCNQNRTLNLGKIKEFTIIGKKN